MRHSRVNVMNMRERCLEERGNLSRRHPSAALYRRAARTNPVPFVLIVIVVSNRPAGSVETLRSGNQFGAVKLSVVCSSNCVLGGPEAEIRNWPLVVLLMV